MADLSVLVHDPNARIIILKDWSFCIVDAEDYEWARHYNWGHHLWHTNAGYARRWGSLNGAKPTNVLIHREIMACPKGMEVDHINHYTLDNRRSNLQVVTKAGNMANARKTVLPRSSKHKGVTWYKAYQKWSANIMRDGVRYHLGYFLTEDEAGAAYNNAALQFSTGVTCLNQL